MDSTALKFDHAAIWVRDLETMRDFYVTKLGGASGVRYDNPKTGFSSYFVSFGSGARIELMSKSGLNGRQNASTGWAHVALSAGSRAAVDALVEKLAAEGVAIQGHPRVTGDGYYEAVILDAEGNEVEITA